MGKGLTVGKKTEIINPLYKTPVKSHISRYTVLIAQGEFYNKCRKILLK